MTLADPAAAAKTASGRSMRLVAYSMLGLVVLPVLALGVQGDDEVDSFQKVVEYHLGHYSHMEPQDLYKLAFQAAMGSEHAVASREAARQWLERELSGLPAGPPEPLIEPLSPDGALVRINLRTLIERGGEVDLLLDGFVETAERFEGSEDRLRSYWSDIATMAEEGELAFELVQLQGFFSEMESQGFPPVHHSAEYRDHYHPAYRVVLIELLAPSTLENADR